MFQMIEEGKSKGHVTICVMKGGKTTTIFLGQQERPRLAPKVSADLPSFSSLDTPESGTPSRDDSEASNQDVQTSAHVERPKSEGKRGKRSAEGLKGRERTESPANALKPPEQQAGPSDSEETDHEHMLQLGPSSLRRVRGLGRTLRTS